MIESKEDAGTKIYLQFPANPHRKNVKTERRVPEKIEKKISPLNVLIVDDEVLVREVVSQYMKLEGHIVETARNGREGFEKFCLKNFDLVITDQAMPEMSGDQLAAKIKKKTPAKPVILLTGFGEILGGLENLPA